MEGKTQEAAAAAAGMSVRTARIWESGPLPSEKRRQRDWRTRPDPFAEVWSAEVEPLLRHDTEGILEATTIFELMRSRHPDRYQSGQLRTLQRRLRDWRALNGPGKEVFFPQEHVAGREAQADFTKAGELGVRIAGEHFDHLLFQLVLSYSDWRYADIALGETFEALVRGMQRALFRLGAVPEVLRTDNLSAATHGLKRTKGRSLTVRFAAVLDHYGLRSTRINPGASNENGVVEQANYRLKSALAQALVIRGSADFLDVAEYRSFVDGVVEGMNRHVETKLVEERRYLRPLPATPVPEYSVHRPRVSKWTVIRVANKTYSVPSSLIGQVIEVRQYADTLEIYYKGSHIAEIERLRGDQDARIDYRHLAESLVRKPGAFARYRFREQLFPTPAFRLAYDALRRFRGDRADVEYVRILHLAATTMESQVERALVRLLDSVEPFGYEAVRQLAAPARPEVPQLASLGKVIIRLRLLFRNPCRRTFEHA
jgi:transposase